MTMPSRPSVPARTPLALAAFLAAVGATGAAHAQSAAAPAAAASQPESRKDVQPAVQEVVISAQKRVERLVDTPVAAAVVGGEALDKANATDITDINKLVPSVQLKGSFNGRVPYSMRGVSTNANEATVGLTSGVSLMIDGVPVPSDSTDANDLQDIARVEVLKGPQSTLGGRTASAGVINFVTQSPSHTFGGNASVTATTDKELRGNLFVAGPISEMLAYSLSAYDYRREYPIHNLMLDENSQSEGKGLRAKLLFSPDRTLDITLAAHVADTDSKGETFTYQYLTPGAQLFPFFPWNNGSGVPQSTALPGIDVHFGNTDYASPVHMFSHDTDRDASLNIEKRVGDYTFTSTTAHQADRQDIMQDVTETATYFLNDLRGPLPTPDEGGPPYFYNNQSQLIAPKSFTQEFKVASPLADRVSYVTGLFYSDTDVPYTTRRAMFVNPDNRDIDSRTRSLGLYGRATWTLAPDTSALTGLRYNVDKVGYSIQDLDSGYGSSATDTSHALVGDLTMRQKLGKDEMVYATYARGYKPRAYNTGVTLANDTPITPAEKEAINHLELGGKGAFLQGRLNVSASLFNTDYKNYQVQIFDESGGGYVSTLVLSNAGHARTQGAELDTQWAATPSTHFNFSAAYINARFITYTGAPCYPGQTAVQGCTVDAAGNATQNLSGKPMPDASKFKFVLGADHNLEQSLVPWDLAVNANYAFRTTANFQADQNPYTVQKSFGILDVGATASSPDGKYTVGLFVNNVLDKFYLVNAEDFFSGLWGTGNAVVGQPARDARRYAGVRFGVDF